jgi:RNA polymerase sigma-70 factor (ECF subfamily)
MENQLISDQADTLTGPSDADLVRRARTTEDQEAFAVLYRRYVTLVYRYLYARTGDVQQAEDLTAQTFVAALEGLAHYRERGTFAGWLFTIAARRLADHFRHRPTAQWDDVTDRTSPDPSPEASVEHTEQMTRLAHAVQTLAPGRAQAVALHFFGELSLGDTARVMGRSKVAVKSLIHRALRDLREELDDDRE